MVKNQEIYTRSLFGGYVMKKYSVLRIVLVILVSLGFSEVFSAARVGGGAAAPAAPVPGYEKDLKRGRDGDDDGGNGKRRKRDDEEEKKAPVEETKGEVKAEEKAGECTLCLEPLDNGEPTRVACIVLNPAGSIVLHKHHKDCFDNWKKVRLEDLEAKSRGPVNPAVYREKRERLVAGNELLCDRHTCKECIINSVKPHTCTACTTVSLQQQLFDIVKREKKEPELTALPKCVELFMQNGVTLDQKITVNETECTLLAGLAGLGACEVWHQFNPAYNFEASKTLVKLLNENKLEEKPIYDAHKASLVACINVGACPDLCYGFTLLHFAAYHGDFATAKLLCEKGADRNIRNLNGFTALIIAVENGYHAIVRLLLRPDAAGRVADRNIRTVKGSTALIFAAWNRHHAIMTLLLEPDAVGRVADMNLQTENGFTALMIAAWGGRHEVANTLLAAGADVTKKLRDGKSLGDIVNEKIKEIKKIAAAAAAAVVPPLTREQINERINEQTQGMQDLLATLTTRYPGAF